MIGAVVLNLHLLIVVLVVLAIIALIIFLVRRGRTRL